MWAECDVSVKLEATAEGVRGTVVVEARERLARARRLRIDYAVARGCDPDTILNEATETLALPPGGLEIGVHEYPFVFHFEGDASAFAGLGARQRVEATLELGWSIDPTGRSDVGLLGAERAEREKVDSNTARRTPRTARSPLGYHPEIVLEVALGSSTIREHEAIQGRVALRAGRVEDVISVTLTLAEVHGEVRATTNVGRAQLMNGAAAPFSLRDVRGLWAAKRYELRIGANLVSAPVSWVGGVKRFPMKLDVVPSETPVEGELVFAPIGAERLRSIAHEITTRAGLEATAAPSFFVGIVGPVVVKLHPHAVDDDLGVVGELRFPDLGLDFAPASAAAVESTLREGLERAVEVEVSGEHLRARFSYDEQAGVVSVARLFHAKASRLRELIATLPSRQETTERAIAAWRAAAANTGGHFVASVPAIHRVPLVARVADGDDVSLHVDLRTAHGEDGPRTVAFVDLSSTPLPASIDHRADVGRSAETMAAIRAIFPEVAVSGARATLVRPGAIEDPAPLVEALDAFLSWSLEVRGLRRETGGPYR